MTPALLAALALGLWIYVFFILFVAIMGFYRLKLQGTLSPFLLRLGFPALVVGYAFDIISNLTLACFVFADIPREWLVTGRLKRYMAGKDGYRKRVATFLCQQVLNMFDPKGEHC